MATLALRRPELVDRFRQISTERGVAAETLLELASKEFLDRAARQKICAESESFRKMRPQLVAKYLGNYVAIHNGKVVDHDPDVRTLHLRIRRRYGRAPILLRQVTKDMEQPEMVFRSPRLERIR